MLKKIKASKENNLGQEMKEELEQDSEDQEENQYQESQASTLMNNLLHPGFMAYQFLSQIQHTNKLLERIAIAEERRNEIAEEEYSDEDDEQE